jgi:iron complex outermembrane receptor protein
VFGGELDHQQGIGNCFVRDWCKPAQVITNNNFNTPAGIGNGQPNFVRNDSNAGFWMTSGGVVAGTNPIQIRNLFGTGGIQFDASGNPQPYSPGSLVSGVTQLGGTILPTYLNTNLTVPVERYTLYSHGDMELTDNITGFVDASFGHVTGSVLQSSIFDAANTIGRNNPFIPAQIKTVLAANPGIASFTMGRVGDDLERGFSTSTANVKGATAGLNGKFGDSATWNTYYQFARTDRLQTVEGNRIQGDPGKTATDPTNPLRFARAVDAVLDTETVITPQTGDIVCAATLSADPALRAAAAGCVPLNLFGPPGSITPEMARFIGGTESTINRGATLAQVHAVVSGDFGWNLPWATHPIGFAVGAEHRDYTGHTRPDFLAQQAGQLGGAGGAILPIEGGYTAEDAFAELIVPIVADRPFFNELQLEGGYRHSHYVVDTTGKPKFSADTYKIGGTWAPIPEIKFRGNYQQAVRAPNIAELFAPVVTGLTALSSDPCAGAAPLTNPNLAAVCIAQGASPGALGAIPNPTAGQANATGGGNPFLKPETSHSWTVGVVLNPRGWLPGFNATLDYYNIKIKDAINAPLSTDVINACFANITAASATDPACTSIRRNLKSGGLSGSTANVAGLPVPLSNSGRLNTDGFDLTANYRHGLGWMGANLILNFNGNYTRKSQFFASDSVLTAPNCPGTYSASCGISIGQLQPKWSWNQRTTLSFKPVDVSLLWRHISSFDYEFAGVPGKELCRGPSDPIAPSTCTGQIRGGPYAGQKFTPNHIPAFDYFDLSTRFSITDHYDLTLTAFNLFDKQPPNVGNNAGTTSANSGNTFPSTYDALGRRYSATVRLKF